MSDFFTKLRNRQYEITAQIATHAAAINALTAELSDIASAGRVFATLARDYGSRLAASEDQGPASGEVGTSLAGVEGDVDRPLIQTGGHTLDPGGEDGGATVAAVLPATYSLPVVGGDTTEGSPDPAPSVGAIPPETAIHVPAGSPCNVGGDHETVARSPNSFGTAGTDDGAKAGLIDDTVRRADASNKALGSDVEAVAPAGKSGEGSIPSPAPTLASRLRALNNEHPEYTATEAAEALGLDRDKVRTNSNVNGVRWAAERYHKSRQPSQDGRSPAPAPTPAPKAERPPVDTLSPRQDGQFRFVPPDNEMAETTAKRVEVDALHRAEPWLSPDEAAARLLIPVVNLRIFTVELGIEWSQPRPVTGADMLASPTGQPQMMTLRDKVKAMHQHHPEWTAKMIADQLGASPASVSTYLAEVRSRAKAEAALEPFVGEAALRQHYSDTRKRLGATS